MNRTHCEWLIPVEYNKHSLIKWGRGWINMRRGLYNVRNTTWIEYYIMYSRKNSWIILPIYGTCTIVRHKGIYQEYHCLKSELTASLLQCHGALQSRPLATIFSARQSFLISSKLLQQFLPLFLSIGYSRVAQKKYKCIPGPCRNTGNCHTIHATSFSTK